MLYLIGRSDGQYYVLDTDDYIIERVSFEQLKESVELGLSVSGLTINQLDVVKDMSLHLDTLHDSAVIGNKNRGISSFVTLPVPKINCWYIVGDKYSFCYNANKQLVHILVHGTYYCYRMRWGVWTIYAQFHKSSVTKRRTKIMSSVYFIGYDKDSESVVAVHGGSVFVFFNSEHAFVARDLLRRVKSVQVSCKKHMSLSEFKRLVLIDM